VNQPSVTATSPTPARCAAGVRRVAVSANAGPAIAAAMELVAGTNALIDLRHNGDGSPEGVAFWCSRCGTGNG